MAYSRTDYMYTEDCSKEVKVKFLQSLQEIVGSMTRGNVRVILSIQIAEQCNC